MELLSEDDLTLRGMSDAELVAAWELWFELAQHTNDADPDYTHGVFVDVDLRTLSGAAPTAVSRTQPHEHR
ncbi:MAG: hypothetical protein IPK26_04710 [Planctomycetes bacterium]|nr:hypothetical protein [Planctomycetota bacterium]